MSVETRLMTADEFEDFITQEANIDRHLELIHGEVVEDMPTEEHGIIVGNLYFHLRNFVKAHGLGRVVIEVRRKVDDDKHNVRIPDIDFTSNERLEARDNEVVRQGAVPQMPDLAVEVQSTGQSDRLMFDKAAFYLANGTRMVWLVYPRKGMVEVLTADDRHLLTGDETLDGGDVLPGFTLSMTEVFEDVNGA